MTMKFAAIAAAAVLAALSTAQAAEQVTEAGGWGIYRDAAMGNGCYMMSAFEDGSVVQIGHDVSEEADFLTVMHSDWAGLSDEQTYTVIFNLDGESWQAEAHSIGDDELGGLLVLIENPDFIVDLATKNSLSMVYDGEEVVLLDLGGTGEAVNATVDCILGGN